MALLHSRTRARVVRNYFAPIILAALTLLSPGHARAEKVLLKDGGFEFYTDGRVGGFVSYVHGDGFPQPPYVIPANGGGAVALHAIKGGGWAIPAENHLLNDPSQGPTAIDQGTVDMMRVRSGFIGNVLGFGARDQLTPNTKITGYFQMWAYIESMARLKSNVNPVDVRQGYAKIEGVWGSVLVGRTRTLFSRGATDIDVMYAHRWGVGFPNAVDSNGPTLGQVGFGVLGSGFASGVIYGTPTLAGFQLNAGIFDPIALQGASTFNRTRFGRPEGELTFEHDFGTSAKVVAFTNGAVQNVYKGGYCPPPSTTGQPCQQTASGFGYGVRVEVGPVHLGFAGHRGKGLGLTYALEQSDAAQDQNGALRLFDGYYGQSQFVIGPVELFGGAGISRVFLNGVDKTMQPDPRDPTGATLVVATSVIKYQFGINAGVVYNMTPNVHFDFDYFRAQAVWYLGEQQVLNCYNGGMTFSW
jgi:Gram-negative porin